MEKEESDPKGKALDLHPEGEQGQESVSSLDKTKGQEPPLCFMWQHYSGLIRWGSLS